jgi:uncharacterized protein involved in exopolysaccharide biosynthesis
MNLDLAFYLRLFWYRLPIMALFVVIGSIIGGVTAYRAPETWSASARLLVASAQISDDLVGGNSRTNAVEQLDIIENKLLTRANLIDIANSYQVFANLREMEPDTVYERMLKNTSIERRAGRNKATLMTLTFQGRDSRVVANVVNQYVTLVRQEDIEIRAGRAESTLSFFQQEVERLDEDLANQSARIAQFRAENSDALPEDQSYRLARQALLQERIARIEREEVALREQLVDLERIVQEGGFSPQGAPKSSEEQKLIIAQADLTYLIEEFGEDNPRTKRQRNTVQRLQSIVDAQRSAAGLTDEDIETTGQAVLEARRAEVENRMTFLASDRSDTQAELNGLLNAISKSSSNGIQLDVLEREYENIQTRYNATVNNLNAAQMTDRIERTAQGQRIEVIENAAVPLVPTGPNRIKIALLGALAGIAMAMGYFALLELLNQTVRRPAELVARFNVTPIATIPYMESSSRRMIRRGGILLLTLALAGSVGGALWYIDSNVMPLVVIMERGLDKLGLG